MNALKISHFLSKKFLVSFAFAIVCMSVLIGYIDSKDAALKKAKSFLMESAEIKQRLGNVASINVKKRFYVNATADRPSYNEYIFFVQGNKAEGFVTVRVNTNTSANASTAISIFSIEVEK